MAVIHTSRRAIALALCLGTLAILPVGTDVVRAVPSTPSAPQLAGAVPGPGPGQVTLAWTAPADDGGSPVTSYNVYRGAPGQARTQRASTSDLSFVDDCTGHGRTWDYQVAAANAAGEGTRTGVLQGLSGAPPAVGDSMVVLGARLPSARLGTAAVWTGTHAFVFGGDQGPVDNIVRYDPTLDCAQRMDASLPGTFVHPSATWNGLHAHIFGGSNGILGVPHNEIIRYDPAEDEAAVLEETLLSARAATSAVFYGGQHLLFGGRVPNGLSETDTDEVLNALDAVVQSELPERRSHTAAALAGDRALVFGGRAGWFEYPQIFAYNITTQDMVTQQSVLPHEGIQGASAQWDGRYAYVLGGRAYTGDVLNQIQRYDPASDGNPSVIPTLAQTLPDAVTSASTAWDGRHIYLFGGENDQEILDTIVRYTPPLPSERAPPQAVSASRGPGAGQITLSWQPPPDASGLTGYRVYRGLTSFTTILHGAAGTTPSFLDTGLVEGQEWCYRVTALFGSAESRISGAVCAKVPERPSAPQALSATPGANLGEVNLSWQDPTSTGGLPLQGYRVFRNGVPVADIANWSFVDDGLPAWTAVTYTVRAINAVGESPPSNTPTTYPASVPSAPQGFTGGGTGPGAAQLTWNAPAVLGAGALSAYRVYRTWPSGNERWVAEPAGRQWRDEDVPQGSYGYRVAAVNRFGEGPSTPILQIDVHVLPGRPFVGGSPEGPGTIRVNWSLRNDGGAAPQKFELYRSTDHRDLGLLVATRDGAERTFADVVGLPGNYFYRVAVENELGKVMGFQGRVFLPPIDCGPSGCVPGIQVCGTIDTANMDDDEHPDCDDLDIDGDHLSNDLEEALGTGARDPDSDGDGLRDNRDPVLLSEGFGVVLEISKLCVNVNYDLNVGGLEADPYLGSDATVRLGAVAPDDDWLIRIQRLSLDSHYHNQQCVTDFAEAGHWNIRDVIFPLPGLESALWELYSEEGVPQLEVYLPLWDHDASCWGDGHSCNEGDDDEIGYPDRHIAWTLMTLAIPGVQPGTTVDSLWNTELTRPFRVEGGNPLKIEMEFLAGLNASPCDILTAALASSTPTAPEGPIITPDDVTRLSRSWKVEGACPLS